jgi:hypothetical protein
MAKSETPLIVEIMGQPSGIPRPNSPLGQVPAGNQARLAQGWTLRLPNRILVPSLFLLPFKTVALVAISFKVLRNWER